MDTEGGAVEPSPVWRQDSMSDLKSEEEDLGKVSRQHTVRLLTKKKMKNKKIKKDMNK